MISTGAMGEREAPVTQADGEISTRRHNPVSGSLLAGLIMVGIVVAVAIVGMVLPASLANNPDYAHVLAPPSLRHLMGTDEFGRDILMRILAGAHLTLAVGVLGTLASAVIGVPVGILVAFYGHTLDDVVMRIVDVVLAFPGLLLAIGVIAILGPGLQNVFIAIIVYGAPVFARIVRGQAIIVARMDYVEAARAVGAKNLRVMANYVLRNSWGVIVVSLSLHVAGSILVASSLGFLGFGAQPPTPEWGAMLAEGREFLPVAPWVDLFPGGAIFFAVLGFNLLGDGLHRRLDPQERR
jgi:glutathione transport system permease protein